MKTASEMIVFQEIPDEISLSLAISNCPNNCPGCHSPQLRTDCGKTVMDVLPSRLEQYKGMISCILFMGGDDDGQIQDLLKALKFCRAEGYKTALYSGFDTWPTQTLLDQLDYIKIGRYIAALGGLKSPITNQRLYKKENEEWKDITYMFWTSDKNK